ncbi:MAG: hypothetical protein KatS3mg060_0517 [Dehalococcoidia bacterium]|jgi:hypothetical protein|nr:MAG: hypothetical protein KatS3mg060_0517 [Dehalococcoidia bacterium]
MVPSYSAASAPPPRRFGMTRFIALVLKLGVVGRHVAALIARPARSRACSPRAGGRAPRGRQPCPLARQRKGIAALDFVERLIAWVRSDAVRRLLAFAKQTAAG